MLFPIIHWASRSCIIVIDSSLRLPRLALFFSQHVYMGSCHKGIQGHLEPSAVLNSMWQCRLCWWHAARCLEVSLILDVTYLHTTLHLLHCSSTPSDLQPLAFLHLGGVACSLNILNCLSESGVSPSSSMFLSMCALETRPTWILRF